MLMGHISGKFEFQRNLEALNLNSPDDHLQANDCALSLLKNSTDNEIKAGSVIAKHNSYLYNISQANLQFTVYLNGSFLSENYFLKQNLVNKGYKNYLKTAVVPNIFLNYFRVTYDDNACLDIAAYKTNNSLLQVNFSFPTSSLIKERVGMRGKFLALWQEQRSKATDLTLNGNRTLCNKEQIFKAKEFLPLDMKQTDILDQSKSTDISKNKNKILLDANPIKQDKNVTLRTNSTDTYLDSKKHIKTSRSSINTTKATANKNIQRTAFLTKLSNPKCKQTQSDFSIFNNVSNANRRRVKRSILHLENPVLLQCVNDSSGEPTEILIYRSSSPRSLSSDLLQTMLGSCRIYSEGTLRVITEPRKDVRQFYGDISEHHEMNNISKKYEEDDQRKYSLCSDLWNRCGKRTVTSNLRFSTDIEKYLRLPVKNGTPSKLQQTTNHNLRFIKISRTSLKRISIKYIANSVFKTFFHSYALVGGRLKSGAAITKSNSNFWLKKAGLVTDSISKNWASDLFLEIAGTKVVLNIYDYVRFLMMLARHRKTLLIEIVGQLTECEPPHTIVGPTAEGDKRRSQVPKRLSRRSEEAAKR